MVWPLSFLPLGLAYLIFFYIASAVFSYPPVLRTDVFCQLGCLRSLFVCCGLIVLLVSLFSCSKVEPNQIRFGLAVAPVTLDPRYATDVESYRVNRLLYRSLVDFDHAFNVVPDLAHWQQYSLRHYRFVLGTEGRQFHHGSRLSAVDVKATYDSILSADTISPHRGSLHMIDSLAIVDEDTVDFFLNTDDPLFPGRLVFGILPADLIQETHAFNRQPVGSGRFRWVDRPDQAQFILQRITDQQTIQFLINQDPLVRSLKLLRGELDIIQGNLSPELIDWLAKNEAIRLERKPGNIFTYMGFNLLDPILQDVRVRKAIAHAIDRDAIIQYVLRDTADIAGTLLPRTHWAGHADLNGYPYDPERAKHYLQQAGLTLPIELDYKTSNSPFRLRLATIFQEQLRQVGIIIKIRSYDWGTFYGDIKEGAFQLYSLSWVGLKMPDVFRYIFHSQSLPPHGANRGRLQDAQVDRLVELAEQATDRAQQRHHYQALQAYLHDQAIPFVPLWYEHQVALTRAHIRGYTLHPDGHYDSLYHVRDSRL